MSYIEWVQTLQQVPWSTKLEAAASEVFAPLATGQDCSIRDATYRIATRRLKEAFWTAGI